MHFVPPERCFREALDYTNTELCNDTCKTLRLVKIATYYILYYNFESTRICCTISSSPRERKGIWRYLESNHILLSGPRRLGRTSHLQRLTEEASEQGWFPRLMEVQGIDTANAFVAELNQSLSRRLDKGFLSHAGAKVDNLVRRFKKVDLEIPGGLGGSLELQAFPEAPWTASARALQQRLSPIPALILTDELTVLLEKLLARDRAGDRAPARLAAGLASGHRGGVPVRLFRLHRFPYPTRRYDLVNSINDAYDLRLGPFRRARAGKPRKRP